MRKSDKLMRLYFYVANVFVICASIALLLIPICKVDVTGKVNALSITVAVIFWLGLILSQIFIWLCNAKRRKSMKKEKKIDSLSKTRPGIVTFNRNLIALIMDLLMIISAIAIVVLVITETNSSWFIMTSTSMLFLSFNLHCYWNGKNYRYIEFLNKEKRRRENNEE